MKLSAVVLTNKPPEKITTTLESVSFADETIVLRDDPKYDPLVDGFAAQRNLGLSKAKGDWVLFVDDDEVITKELAEEIKKAISINKFNAYYLKRRDIYFGQILKHGEAGNMKIIRLAKKTAGKFIRPVHEVWQVSGAVGELSEALLHYREDLATHFLDRIGLYGPLDATALDAESKPFSHFRLLANPVVKFLFNYFLRLGFLDGYLGLFQAYLMSVQSLSVRVFQWQPKS